MKNYRLSLLLFFAAWIVISACSMEKRVYRSGYHIEWLSAKTKQPKKSKENSNQKRELNELSEVEIID